MQYFEIKLPTKNIFIKNKIELLELMFALLQRFFEGNPTKLNNNTFKNAEYMAILRFRQDNEKDIPNRAFLFFGKHTEHFITFALPFVLIKEKGQYFFRLKFSDDRNLDFNLIKILINLLNDLNGIDVNVIQIYVDYGNIDLLYFAMEKIIGDYEQDADCKFMCEILMKLFSFDYGYIRKDKISSNNNVNNSKIYHPTHHLDFSYQHKNYDLKIGLEDNFDLKCFVDLFDPYLQCSTLRMQK